MKRITLACAAGMSTSLLVSKMNLVAATKGMEVKIRAVPKNDFGQYASETDVLLLGPQISYAFEEMKAEYEPKGIKVAVINSMDYGTMNGEKVLNDALNL